MPASTFKPGWRHTTTKVNGRAGPSTSSRVLYVQDAGHNFWASRIVKGGGRTWLVSNRGTFYAADFCAAGKAAKPKPSGRVPSPVPGVGVGTPWGKRPKNRTYWQARGHHTGADYPGRWGAPVVAVRDGRVIRIRESVLGTIALLYADNGKTFWYCHLSAVTKTGKVKAGQQIGRVGQTGTGAAFGPHLHLEVRAGHSAYWGGRDTDPTKAW